jgi:hypothetical protein
MPELNLVANLGLTLFLFIVGLEVDLRFLISNWKVAMSVGLFGMVVPFGMGCAIAVGLYREFKDEPGTVQVNFGIFMLFIGVAMAITVSCNHCQDCGYVCSPNAGLSRTLPYLDRAEAAYDSRGCHCAFSWCRK